MKFLISPRVTIVLVVLSTGFTPVLSADGIPEVKPRVASVFGKVFEMEGEIVKTERGNTKMPPPEWMLKVTYVDGKALEKPVLVGFTVDVEGDEPDWKKNGLKLKFAAYETGDFSGLAHGWNKYRQPIMSTGFGFTHHLVILKVF